MKIEMEPIGFVSTDAKEVPRNWKVSDVEGDLIIDGVYKDGMREMQAGQKIFVFFHFHKSPPFSDKFMRIKPPVYDRKVGVFSCRSPFRPNPIGMLILDVLGVNGTTIHVKSLDMMDGTPILDIKPESCPVAAALFRLRHPALRATPTLTGMHPDPDRVFDGFVYCLNRARYFP